ncbi:unnamed protein product, partial [Prorocentrum cordatum]
DFHRAAAPVCEQPARRRARSSSDCSQTNPFVSVKEVLEGGPSACMVSLEPFACKSRAGDAGEGDAGEATTSASLQAHTFHMQTNGDVRVIQTGVIRAGKDAKGNGVVVPDGMSDELDEFTKKHTSADGVRCLTEKLGTIQSQLGSMVGSAVSKATAPIEQNFTKHLADCMRKCQEEFDALPKKLDRSILDVVNPQIDQLRREFSHSCDDMQAAPGEHSSKIDHGRKLLGLADKVKLLQE